MFLAEQRIKEKKESSQIPKSLFHSETTIDCSYTCVLRLIVCVCVCVCVCVWLLSWSSLYVRQEVATFSLMLALYAPV